MQQNLLVYQVLDAAQTCLEVPDEQGAEGGTVAADHTSFAGGRAQGTALAAMPFTLDPLQIILDHTASHSRFSSVLVKTPPTLG